jgi:hypothetical protein
MEGREAESQLRPEPPSVVSPRLTRLRQPIRLPGGYANIYRDGFEAGYADDFRQNGRIRR